VAMAEWASVVAATSARAKAFMAIREEESGKECQTTETRLLRGGFPDLIRAVLPEA
jgi:hypothetical protein